jgi:hypothetical protein
MSGHGFGRALSHSQLQQDKLIVLVVAIGHHSNICDD